MAKKYKQAIEDLKSLNKLFESVKVLSEALSDSDKIESSIEIAQSKKLKVYEEIELLKKEKEDMLLKIKEVKAEIDSIQDKKLGIIASAKKDAEVIILDANKQKEMIASLLDKERSMNDEAVKMAKSEEAAIKSSIAQKAKDLAELEEKIESTKASFRALVK